VALGKVLMIQGTASHVGKSVMTAALPLRVCAETVASAINENRRRRIARS